MSHPDDSGEPDERLVEGLARVLLGLGPDEDLTVVQHPGAGRPPSPDTDVASGPEISLDSDYLLIADWGERTHPSEWAKNLLPANDAQRIVVHVPRSWLSTPRESPARQALGSRWHIDTVIEFIDQGPDMGAALESGLISVSSTPGPTRFVREKHHGRKDLLEALRRVMRMSGGSFEDAYVIRELDDPEYGLGYDLRDPALLQMRQSVGKLSTTRKLTELLSILRPRPGSPPECQASDEGAARVISPRNITPDHEVEPPDPDAKWVIPPDGYLLQAGDLIVGPYLAEHRRLKVGIVRDRDTPLTINNGFILRGEIDENTRTWIADYLASEYAVGQIRSSRFMSRIAGRIRIDRRALADLDVPDFDEDLATALEDLKQAASTLRTHAEEAESVLADVFGHAPMVDLRRRLIDRGRLVRKRSDAATAVDNPSTRFRTEYPYPIALWWREAEFASAGPPTPEAVDAVVDAYEALLGFQACVGSAICVQAGVLPESVRQLWHSMRTDNHSVVLGDWRDINQNLAGRKLRGKLAEDNPVLALHEMWSRNDVKEAAARLSSLRNDESHRRRLDEVSLPSALDQAREDLRLLFGASDRWSDIQLVHVIDFRWDQLRSTGLAEVRRITGDHPVVRKSAITTNVCLEKGSLYALDTLSRWHLLRPFLRAELCPTCRSWSSFFLEKLNHSEAILQSLEHGHEMTKEASGVLKEFELVLEASR